MPLPVVRSNAEQIAARMQARAAAVGPISRFQAERVRAQVLKVSLKHMDRLIYSIPEDRNVNGTRKWVRTNRLRENERASVEVSGNDFKIILKNRMRYSKMRHEMGKPGTERPKPENRPYRRFAPWRDRTISEMRRWSNLRNQEALRRILGTGGIDSTFRGRT